MLMSVLGAWLRLVLRGHWPLGGDGAVCDGKVFRCRCERVLELRRRNVRGLDGIERL